MTVNTESEPGVDRMEIAPSVGGPHRHIRSMLIDNVRHLGEGALAERCKNIVGTRWW